MPEAGGAPIEAGIRPPEAAKPFPKVRGFCGLRTGDFGFREEDIGPFTAANFKQKTEGMRGKPIEQWVVDLSDERTHFRMSDPVPFYKRNASGNPEEAALAGTPIEIDFTPTPGRFVYIKENEAFGLNITPGQKVDVHNPEKINYLKPFAALGEGMRAEVVAGLTAAKTLLEQARSNAQQSGSSTAGEVACLDRQVAALNAKLTGLRGKS